MKNFMLTMILLITILGSTANTANAQEEFVLSEDGFWTTKLKTFADGTMGCVTESVQHEENGDVFGMHIWTFGDGLGFWIQLADNRFNFRPEDNVTVFLSVDGFDTEAIANLDGFSVVIGGVTDIEFMVSMASGQTVSWMNSNRVITHQFNLRGLAQAYPELSACNDRITTPTPTY